jgi:peptidoglycan/LPS O-acetylase OafA/YrhL
VNGARTSTSPLVSTARVEGLTVLRGVAIGLVLLRHAAPETFGGAGIVGVTIFFALSGWLITGLLLADLGRTGRVDYRRFYLDRVLRLYPALLLFVAVLALVGIVWDPLGQGPTWRWAVPVALTYTADLPLGIWVGTASTHLWTLAVEEQFYLVWPFLLTSAFRRRLLRRGVLVAVLLCWAAAAVSVLAAGDDVVRAYPLPTSWFVALAVGGLARTVDLDRLRRLLDRRAVLAVAVVVLAGACLLPDLKANPLTYLLGGPVIAAGTVVLVVAALPHQRVRSLPARALVGLGTISYAAYLWNWALATWADAAFDGRAAHLAVTPATVVVAAFSWYALERPVLRARDRRRRAAVRTPLPGRGHGAAAISAASPSPRPRP